MPENLSEQGETIAVFDWDDTIANWDDVIRTNLRTFEARESGENGTVGVIRALQKRGIKTMVLTGRHNGEPLDKKRELFEGTVTNMLELVGSEEWMQQAHSEIRKL